MIELLCLATTVAGGGGGCDAPSLALKKMTGSGLYRVPEVGSQVYLQLSNTASQIVQLSNAD
jgi:hypothetical protein